MKQVILILTLFLAVSITHAQSPDNFSYQAVIRNRSNDLVTNQEIGLQVSILQGSADGDPVFVEVQAPVTNANGLVSLVIGGGDATTGRLADIDWANGPYFLKTEIDITGGSGYGITATTQLLSVPYALHANTAESLSGDIEESDPIFSESPAVYITDTDIENLSNLSGVNTGDQDLSELASQNSLEDSVTAIRSDISFVKSYSVGDLAQGGIVFWVDETGQHGLACFLIDWGNVQWYNSDETFFGAYGNGLYSGEMNTALVSIKIGGSKNYAAGLCASMTVTQNDIVYGDWYLPSSYEQGLMYDAKSVIDSVATENGGEEIKEGFYWGSTEYSTDGAYGFHFNLGISASDNKIHGYYIRSIRRF